MIRRRFDILDAWRSLAVLLMLGYHFLYDLYIFGVLTAGQMFSPPLCLLQKFICCSFILLAGISARFSRSNLRHGVVVLLAGAAVETGAAIGGQTIRFGILMFMGTAMLLYHFAGRRLQKIPGLLLTAGCSILFPLTAWWTGQAQVSAGWLYPLGFMPPGFYSADYFPLFPWLFLFLFGTVLGGLCLDRRDSPLLARPLPPALTWLGRHSLTVYVLHQPALYGISYFIWG